MSEFVSMMRILLRCKQTGLYFAHGNHWTAEAGKAYHFNLEEYAINRAFAFRLEDIELVYEFPDPRQNFTIPVALFPARPTRREMAETHK